MLESEEKKREVLDMTLDDMFEESIKESKRNFKSDVVDDDEPFVTKLPFVDWLNKCEADGYIVRFKMTYVCTPNFRERPRHIDRLLDMYEAFFKSPKFADISSSLYFSFQMNVEIDKKRMQIADFIISLNLKPDDISTVLDLFAFYGMTLRYFKSRFIVNRVQSYITSGLEVLSIYGPLYINCEYQEIDLERIDEIRQGKKVLYPSDEEMLVVYVHPFCDKDKDSDQNIDKMEHEAVRRWTTKHGRYAPKTLKEEFIMDAFKIDKNTIAKSTRIGFRSAELTFNIVRKSLDISKYLEGI
jgi:hypothetical protein